MIIQALLIACIVLASSVNAGGVQATQPARSDFSPPPESARIQNTFRTCWESDSGVSMPGSPSPGDRLMRGAPVGLTLTPVAVARTEGLPPPPVRLSLARMEYGSETGTGTRRASGPLLFVVEAGTIDLYRNGEPTRLGPGAAALVQMNQRYAFVNDSSTPVTLLRLALSPPNATDKPVLDFIDITPTPSQVLTPPTRTWLFQGELLVLPSGPVDLFVVCATWASQPGDASTYQYSVPVGLNMLEGTLHIDDQAVLAADGCTLFAPQHAYRVRSGDGQSRGLLFGVLPMGQNLWLPPTGVGSDPPAPRDGVSCGDVP